MLKDKNIVLGVSGGIAVYKAVDLVSKLVQAGAHVRVVMSEAATNLVNPITFKEISGNFVATNMWSGNQEFNVEHIALATWADVMVVAPATANIIGKMASGIADDLLSTTIMACTKPVIVCPAMNTGMYNNPAVQENLATLARRGITIMEPASGYLACGTSGVGRLPEPLQIRSFIDLFLAKLEGDLRGKTFLVTAAGTREPIDPVRYVGNRSSGKMGYAIAKEALARGARVVLVSGPSALVPPTGAEVVSVETTGEMLEAVLKYYDEVDVVVKAAAVADYKPRDIAAQKIKKTGEEGLTVVMDKNPDILKLLGSKKTHQILVGFAAETENLLANAASKIRNKNLDMIVANDVSMQGAGFNTDTNIVKFLFPNGDVVETGMDSKNNIANDLLDIVAKMLQN